MGGDLLGPPRSEREVADPAILTSPPTKSWFPIRREETHHSPLSLLPGFRTVVHRLTIPVVVHAFNREGLMAMMRKGLVPFDGVHPPHPDASRETHAAGQ